MDKDRIKGKVKDVAGRAERQAGEWTGSEEHQAKGLGRQVEGKVQNAVGKVKDAVRGSRDRDVERDEPVEKTPRRKTA
ncbi:MAG: CsbD family protein [Acidobacteria bacterium]|nr:CsbD family protein [Acidobacteriota bacterium]